MTKRTKVLNGTVTDVLTASRRRCCICFALWEDDAEKKGQIAHLDHDPSNNDLDNLAYLCLEHHDQYDTRTAQSKGFTIDELKRYRTELLKFIRQQPRTSDTRKARLERARDHVETRLKKRRGHRASFEAIRNEVDETYSDEFLKELIELNPKIFGRCTLRNGNKPGIALV